MPRPRVLSFTFRSQPKDGTPRSPGSPPDSPATPTKLDGASVHDSPASSPAPPPAGSNRSSSRPTSMIQSYQPPTMDIPTDTLPELQPIFSYINAHANKLYQEGYFLKLHDLDGRGRPSTDRVWNECFAQLVGTVLSLWDAAQLDAAGEDGEVVPTFINLTDASIKMIESLPMNGPDGHSLQNVLSVSTAANNRYLLHFNSLHSLTQWTAGIRLAMYEQVTLQEAYTGSIIAGKGKHVNGIRTIMERTRFVTEDWARVRFGAGTPWRRLWCVVSPPDEKEMKSHQKTLKKRSTYDRSTPIVKGDIKFYETRKITKKTRPVASVTDGYAAYAIYPQSKALIDQSTLVKVEGTINVYQGQETSSEGFLFIMPELHAAVSGFETMLRWMLPVFDTFHLYGRPTRLIADVLDVRSLMFAMPTGRRFGYLEIIDVAGLIHTDGSQKWSEKEWRQQMKNLTQRRMNGTLPSRSGTDSSHQRAVSNSNLHNSRSSFNLPSTRPGIRFSGEDTSRSQPSSRTESPATKGDGPYSSPQKPRDGGTQNQLLASPSRHQRAVSDQPAARRDASPRPPPHEQTMGMSEMPPPPPTHGPSQFSTPAEQFYPAEERWYDAEASNGAPPPPPPHHSPQPPPHGGYPPPQLGYSSQQNGPQSGLKSQNGYAAAGLPPPMGTVVTPDSQPYVPVQEPPRMAHRGSAAPPFRPNQMPDIRRANSAMDAATLAQLRDVNANPNRSGDYAVEQPQRYSQDDSAIYTFSESHLHTSSLPFRGGPPPAGPPPASSQPPTGRRLPTIPGTPAYEQNKFDLDAPAAEAEGADPPNSNRPFMGRNPSSGIARKPVPRP